MKKKGILAGILILAVLVLGFGILAEKPVVSCKAEIPEHYLEAIESQSGGVYSHRLPLIPVYVSVDSFSEGKVYYTIYYFPFGTVGMSYTETDGYNMEKPLTGL